MGCGDLDLDRAGVTQSLVCLTQDKFHCLIRCHRFTHLANGQPLSFSIASALTAGSKNTIVVVGIGPKNSSADFFLGPPPSASSVQKESRS
jgi:hypothetical protein